MSRRRLFYMVAGILMLGGAIWLGGTFSGRNLPVEELVGKRIGLFSWADSAFSKKESERLYTVMHALGVTELYQKFSQDMLYSAQADALMAGLEERGIAAYYLTGRPEWGLEQGEKALLGQVDRVAEYNRTMPKGFAGLMLDVEPYLTDQWDRDKAAVMDDFVRVMKKTYARAQENEVKLILCVPYWYDKRYLPQLDALARHCSDELAVMNYNRTNEIAAISGEVALAQRYGKNVVCIFEFQEAGTHGLTDKETYGRAGLEQGKAQFDRLYNHFGYEGLGFAYHYYEAVK